MAKAYSIAYNPLRHPKSWELRLHEKARVSGSDFTIQQIPKQELINTGLGEQCKSKPYQSKESGKETVKERVGTAGLELRGDEQTACRDTIETAWRGQLQG